MMKLFWTRERVTLSIDPNQRLKKAKPQHQYIFLEFHAHRKQQQKHADVHASRRTFDQFNTTECNKMRWFWLADDYFLFLFFTARRYAHKFLPHHLSAFMVSIWIITIYELKFSIENCYYQNCIICNKCDCLLPMMKSYKKIAAAAATATMVAVAVALCEKHILFLSRGRNPFMSLLYLGVIIISCCEKCNNN